MATQTTAYDNLFQAIEMGEIKPGDRLLETDLAAKFGVSRTPIREAIRRLESEGLVRHLPRVGAVVRKFSQTEIVDLYEMRIVLESTAAQMAAKHISAAELHNLEHLNDDMYHAKNDTIAVAAFNRKFHICIVAAARNQFLIHSYNDLSHAQILLGKTTLETTERIDLVYEQHSHIIAALGLGDQSAAAQAMQTHMFASLKHRLRALNLVD